MLKHKVIKVVLLSTLIVPSVSAQELVLGYDDFYNRMKTSKKNEYKNTQLGVFLTNIETKKHCQINNAVIDFEGAITPVDIGADYELRLPFNKQLRDDKAKLRVTATDKAQCDLAFQIMTVKHDSLKFTTRQIITQVTEFDKFLGDMAGYFGRMNLPTTMGVQFIFAEETNAVTLSGNKFKQGDKISLSQDEIIAASISGLKFNHRPLRIVPLTEKM